MAHTTPLMRAEYVEIETSTQERVLLCAILERAFRDLNLPPLGFANSGENKNARKDAIAWFLADPKPPQELKNELSFSFQTIRNVFSFSKEEITYMLTKARIAEQYEKAVEEGRAVEFRAQAEATMESLRPRARLHVEVSRTKRRRRVA